MEWCDGYGLLLILFALTYISLFYYHILKPFFGKALYRTLIRPLMSGGQALLRPRYWRIVQSFIAMFPYNVRSCLRWIKPIIAVVILVLVLAFVVLDSIETPARLQSLSGIFVLVGIGYVFSAHRRKVRPRKLFDHPILFDHIVCSRLTISLCCAAFCSNSCSVCSAFAGRWVGKYSYAWATRPPHFCATRTRAPASCTVTSWWTKTISSLQCVSKNTARVFGDMTNIHLIHRCCPSSSSLALLYPFCTT